jgi:hypothetical protein
MICNDMMNVSGNFYVANNYAYYFQRSSADGNWKIVNNGVVHFTFDVNGNGSANGWYGNYLHSYGAIYAAGDITSGGGNVYCGSVQASAGLFQIASGYYMQRGNDGAWRFVEGNTVNLTIGANGDTTARNSLYAGQRMVAGGGGFFDNNQDWGCFYAGLGKVHQYAGGWYWDYQTSTGFIRWVGASNEFFYMNPWIISNSMGPMGGHGPYQDYSDERVKEDIEPADVGLAEVLRMRPIRYIRLSGHNGMSGHNKHPRRHEIGFSAQQLRTVIPEAVSIFGITMPDGRDSREHDDPPLGIATTPIVAALVNSDQELHAMIKALTARVAELEQRTIH